MFFTILVPFLLILVSHFGEQFCEQCTKNAHNVDTPKLCTKAVHPTASGAQFLWVMCVSPFVHNAQRMHINMTHPNCAQKLCIQHLLSPAKLCTKLVHPSSPGTQFWCVILVSNLVHKAQQIHARITHQSAHTQII